jgi:four helix bundle protein
MNNIELEKRLIGFAVAVIEMTGSLPMNNKTKSLVEQVIRSSAAAALNYGEAQSAESKRDFIHKISIVMKELRETQINLSIMSRLIHEEDANGWRAVLKENNELLAIFHKTIQTARKKLSD